MSPAQSPDLNLSQHFWHELRASPYRPTSVADLTNAFVAEWEQILAEKLQNQLKSEKSSIIMMMILV